MSHPRLVAEVVAYASFVGVRAAAEHYGLGPGYVARFEAPVGSWEPIPHRSHQAYKNFGCRCKECREWYAGYQASNRAKRREREMNEAAARATGFPGDWTLQAACVGKPTDLFFGENGAGEGRAKRICADCPVRIDCLAWALEHEPAGGIWGGTTTHERFQMNKRRRIAS